MRRATGLIVLAILVSWFFVLMSGCNRHPTKEVEYVHHTGQAPETGTETSSEDSESSTSEGAEEGTDEGLSFGTGIDTDESGSESTDDGGPVCGNGIVEDGEQCDEGMANGEYPSICSDMCLWNELPQ